MSTTQDIDQLRTDHYQNEVIGLSDTQKYECWNHYCQEAGYGDDEIHDNDDDFFDAYFQGKVIDAVRACYYGDYNYSHAWVKFNGSANLDSSNSIEDLISIDEMTAYIEEHPEEFTQWVETFEEPEEEEDEEA